jgi:hypothetical protein
MYTYIFINNSCVYIYIYIYIHSVSIYIYIYIYVCMYVCIHEQRVNLLTSRAGGRVRASPTYNGEEVKLTAHIHVNTYLHACMIFL